jgi:ribosomal protein L7/L12
MTATGSDLPPEARTALAAGNKIEAIKILREQTGLGLAEAKDIVDRAERGADPRARVTGLSDGKLPLEATVTLQRGDKIGAIRIVHRAANLDLKDSKGAVEAAIAADPALQAMFATLGAARRRRALLWIVGLLIAAAALVMATR